MPSGDADPDDLAPEPAPAMADAVRIQTLICGRCGWPNACRVQQGMRILRFMCQWCDRMTTGIVDPTMKGQILF